VVLTGLGSVLGLFLVAVPAFGVDVHLATLPATIVTAALGAACLAALAAGSLVRTSEQAMPLAQLMFLPVSFISGVWFPLEGAPSWVTTTADVFPLKHIVGVFTGCFLAGAPDAGFAWTDLAVIAAWGSAGWPWRRDGCAARWPHPEARPACARGACALPFTCRSNGGMAERSPSERGAGSPPAPGCGPRPQSNGPGANVARQAQANKEVRMLHPVRDGRGALRGLSSVPGGSTPRTSPGPHR
jgi:hypothetical protein